ncbi:MAG: DUF3775 domain-containing protein [Gemmataceae bacterium]|nr:DUF3775 domain-containing protein [Gemmataceae bacterium]
MPFSETVNRVIDLAAAIREDWNRELPQRHPDYLFIGEEGEDDGQPPLKRSSPGPCCTHSPPDTYKLGALLYLGREDYRPTEFAVWCGEVMPATFPNPKWAIGQMTEKAPLGDYLRDGLEALARAGVDVDAPVTAAA